MHLGYSLKLHVKPCPKCINFSVLKVMGFSLCINSEPAGSGTSDCLLGIWLLSNNLKLQVVGIKFMCPLFALSIGHKYEVDHGHYANAIMDDALDVNATVDATMIHSVLIDHTFYLSPFC